MLRSFCIKTNNTKIINYMLYQFENSNMEELYITSKEFRIYKNIILHYNGKDVLEFYALIAGILTNVISTFFEDVFVKNILTTNYFYFNEIERNQILKYCEELLESSQKEMLLRKNLIFSLCFDYVKENKYLIIDGFIKFRLKDYIKELDEITDIAVDKYVLDKEYKEFTSLLKLYVDSKEPEEEEVHLIYQSNETTLLDKNKKIIDISSNIFDAKYLSDISFSSNDYALNALLNLLPEIIYIHLIDGVRDEFIETIELIFEERICICQDCAICKIFRMEKNNKKRTLLND